MEKISKELLSFYDQGVVKLVEREQEVETVNVQVSGLNTNGIDDYDDQVLLSLANEVFSQKLYDRQQQIFPGS